MCDVSTLLFEANSKVTIYYLSVTVTNEPRPERLASSDTVILKGDDDRLEQKFTIGKLKLSVGFLTEI